MRPRCTPFHFTVLVLSLVIACCLGGTAAAQVVVSPLADGDSFFQTPASPTLLPKLDKPSAALYLPYFENDVTGGSFKATLFAVRHPGGAPATTGSVKYFDVQGNLRTIEPFMLAPNAVFSRNLRDVPGLVTDPDGFSRGFALIESVGTPLSGDFFQVDPNGNFATGGRLIGTTDLCTLWDFRFALGGAFDGGTTLQIFVNQPLGIGPSDPPSAAVIVYDEAGMAFGTVGLQMNQNAVSVDVGDITAALPGGIGPVFGSLWIGFGPATGGGYIQGTYTAENRYSVSAKGSCLD